jgi:3-mercaptopyruvate sulfurtransferase SseA
VAQQLKRFGITRVRPLAGGFNAWREKGYPLQGFPVETAALAQRSAS